ncbi:MAG: hypothetical protein ACFB6R_16145 [Alphaproteobacteria bacterium]
MAQARFSIFGAIPLIIIAVIIYNILAFAGPLLFGDTIDVVLSYGFDVPLISGDQWRITIADFLVVLGLILLLLEVIRSTQTGSSAITNHALSMLLFIACLIEFIVLKGFGTSAFFLLIMMTLFDVIAGFTVGIVAARRDFGGGGIVTS